MNKGPTFHSNDHIFPLECLVMITNYKTTFLWNVLISPGKVLQGIYWSIRTNIMLEITQNRDRYIPLWQHSLDSWPMIKTKHRKILQRLFKRTKQNPEYHTQIGTYNNSISGKKGGKTWKNAIWNQWNDWYWYIAYTISNEAVSRPINVYLAKKLTLKIIRIFLWIFSCHFLIIL